MVKEMRRCPTCGKPVKNNQEICSYCGSLVTEIRVSTASPMPVSGSAEPVFTNWDMHPRAPTFEGDETAVADTAERVPPPVPAGPVLVPTGPIARPRSGPAVPDEPRRPAPLLRVLILIIFLLVPVFNSLLRNFVFDRPSAV